MRTTTRLRALVTIGAAASVVLPAAIADAHPAIYTQTVSVIRSGAPTPPTQADLSTRVEYYIQNDGRSIILQENNGLTATVHPAVAAVPADTTDPDNPVPAVPAQAATHAGGGMTNFKQFPSTLRGNTALFPTKASWLAFKPAHSDVQLHATCVGVASLSDPDNIVQWQSDPFYGYIPWQAASAGLGDNPAKWIPLVKTLTGVDLSTLTSVSDFTNACTTLGGTYYPADGVVTTPASAASASVADAVAPVQAAKTASDKAAADATAAQQATAAQLAQARTELAAAKTQVASLMLAATPLKLTLGTVPSVSGLLSAGQPLTLTAAPLQATRVRLLTTELAAARLHLKSRVLASTTLTTTATGVLTTKIKPTAAAAAAIKKAKGTLAITVDTLAGQKLVAASAILKR